MTQPTGVFVRLPLSDAQRELMVDAAAFGQPDDSHDKACLDIGTPVTGGELPVITTLGTLRDPVPCVRQSDALAKLAEKDAEIARLNAVINTTRISIANGNPMKAAYAIEASLKGPEA